MRSKSWRLSLISRSHAHVDSSSFKVPSPSACPGWLGSCDCTSILTPLSVLLFSLRYTVFYYFFPKKLIIEPCFVLPEADVGVGFAFAFRGDVRRGGDAALTAGAGTAAASPSTSSHTSSVTMKPFAST